LFLSHDLLSLQKDWGEKNDIDTGTNRHFQSTITIHNK